MNKTRCDACRWWHRLHSVDGGIGECRAHTPRWHPADEDMDGHGIWPWTLPADWCGEYAPAPKEIQEERSSHDASTEDHPP